MARSANISDEEALAKIEQEEGLAYGLNDSELSDSRSKAIKYYNGDPIGNEVEGRSQVVSRDVLDTIEAALPQLLKIFVSGDRVVLFQPKGEEDIDAAEQETDYINHVVMEKNSGFGVFYAWFKDALLSKNGYVKIYYEEENEVETEQYQGLTDGMLAMLLQDNAISVIEHTSYPDEVATQQLQEAVQQVQAQLQQAQQAAAVNPEAHAQLHPLVQQLQKLQQTPPPMIHDVKIEVTETKGCVKLENVAPEDIMVSTDCRELSVQKARFVQHRVMMSREEMEEQGWDVPADLGFTDSQHQWQEANARDLYNEQESDSFEDEILVKDTYIRINGELKRYVVAGNTVLYKDDAEIVPFAVITPHIMPHRHVGMSYADLTMDLQLIKTTLMRGQLDSMYLANSPRFAISDRVNLEDMLTSRPGGIVRVTGEPGAAILPLTSTPPSPISFNMIEYLDSIKEKRTGITAYNQGLDANSLNKTATGINAIQQASLQRLELVARTFAETGVKELFMLVHRLVRTHYTKPDVVRLRNEWIEVDPRQWKSRTDMTIAVGLGTGNKDQQLLHLQNMIGLQMQALQAGLPIVTPENIYNTARQIAINAGFKQPEQFVTDPKEVPPKPPQTDPKVELEKMKLQADAQKFQAETQIEKEKAEQQAQLDIQRFQAEAALKQQESEKQLQQEMLRSQNDIAIERDKLQMQAELEKYKADLDAQTKLQIAQMQAEMQAKQMMHQTLAEQARGEIEQRRHKESLNAMTQRTPHDD